MVFEYQETETCSATEYELMPLLKVEAIKYGMVPREGLLQNF